MIALSRFDPVNALLIGLIVLLAGAELSGIALIVLQIRYNGFRDGWKALIFVGMLCIVGGILLIGLVNYQAVRSSL